MNRYAYLTGLAALTTLLGCGGGDSATPTSPGTTTPPAPAPTARPAPTPTPDPRIGLAAGPVTRYTIKVRTVDNGARDPDLDGQGRYVVFVGERIDFDSTQKNAADQICQWKDNPVWLVNDRDIPDEASTGIIYRRGSSQPFLLKLTAEQRGSFTVRARLDGVESNVLEVRVR